MRIRAQRRLPATGLGVTLCAMAIMTIQSAVSAPHEPEVIVGPGELSHSVVFRIPSVPSSTWVWRMLVGTVDNWCHIKGSLRSRSPVGWEDHFGREVSFFTLGSADTPWAAFQPEFDGKIEPCGGPGSGEVVIHDWDVNAAGSFEYEVRPSEKVACVGTEVEFESFVLDNNDDGEALVKSDWEVAGSQGFSTNATSAFYIAFTPDELGNYVIEGTIVGTGSDKSDTATLTAIGEVITIGSRLVSLPGNIWFGHLSIERWEPNCSVATLTALELETQYTTHEMVNAGYSPTAAWELLRDGDGGEWVVDRCLFGIPAGTISVNVSVILATSTATEHVVVAHQTDVTSEWDTVSQNAVSYRFSEQTGFSGVFQHWPNSRYQNPTIPLGNTGNNSNTFIQWLAAESGIPFIDPPVRAHPGRAAPEELEHPSTSCGGDPYQN